MVRLRPRTIRLLLLVVVPFLLVLVGTAAWLRGGRTVGTDNAYVKADIAQIAPEVSGTIIEVLVSDHQQVEAGAHLVRLDPEPFRLTLEKADAELDNARTAVETARAQWIETGSELAELQSQADYLAKQGRANRRWPRPAWCRPASWKRLRTPPPSRVTVLWS